VPLCAGRYVRVGLVWDAVVVTEWMREVAGPLNTEQQLVLDGLAAILGRLDLPELDIGASSTVVDASGLHVKLIHRSRPDLSFDVNSPGNGEVFVFYGQEEQHFRAQDRTDGRVWPFPSEDHVQATLSMIEGLLSGRIELQVWKRPLATKSRTFWINQYGERELVLRSGTVGLFVGWSRQPEVHRFDFTAPVSGG